MAKSLEHELKAFFTSPLADSAAQGLKEDACIHLVIDEENYFFQRRGKKNQLFRKSSQDPQVRFNIPHGSMRYLLDLQAIPATSLSVIGLAILQNMLTQDPARKITVKVKASWLTLFTLGYFSVLKAGGPEVASYMAKKGFGSILQIKALLQKIRG